MFSFAEVTRGTLTLEVNDGYSWTLSIDYIASLYWEPLDLEMSTYENVFIFLCSLVDTEAHREPLDSQITCSTLEIVPTVDLFLRTLRSGFTG